MKKNVLACALLSVCLLLAGCGGKEAAEGWYLQAENGASLLILFSNKKQALFIEKAPLKASPICAKGADAVSCRLRRAHAL